MDDSYQVTIVKYGARSTVRSDVYLNYPLYGEADASIEMDYFVWIIQNKKRTVLVDTGFSREGGEARQRTFLLDLPATYASLGVDPSTSPPVIITHAHYDHTGNIDYFPTSPVFLAESEYQFWTGKNKAHAQFHHSIEERDLEVITQAFDQGRVTLFTGSHQVAPGIEVIQVGGHTPGQSVVKVKTSDGVVLLASDAVHYYEEYERGMPFAHVANLVDMYDAFDRIRNMVDSGEVTHLVSGHDPGTIGRFTAVPGELAGLAATIGRIDETKEKQTA